MRKNGRSPKVTVAAAAAAAASTTTGSGKTRRGEIKHEDDDKTKTEKKSAEKGVKGRPRMYKAAVGRKVSGAGSDASDGKRGKEGGVEDEEAKPAVVQASPTSPRSSKEPVKSSSNQQGISSLNKARGAQVNMAVIAVNSAYMSLMQPRACWRLNALQGAGAFYVLAGNHVAYLRQRASSCFFLVQLAQDGTGDDA